MEDSASVKFYFCMSEKKILHGFLFNIYLYIAFVVLYGCPKARAPAQKVKAFMAFFLFLFLPLRAQKQFIITLMLLKFGDIETSTP